MVVDSTVMLFLLIGIGAFLWGLGNVVSKKYLDKVHEDVMVVGTMTGAVIFSGVAELAWNGTPKILPGFWIPFIVSAFLNVAIVNLGIWALKFEEASVVVPLASTMPAWAIVGSWVILQEWPTAYQRIGIICISVGAYIIGLKGVDVEMPLFLSTIVPQRFHKKFILFTAPWLRLMYSKGARYAVFQAWLGGAAIGTGKLATLNSSPMIYTSGAFLVVAVLTLAWSRGSGRWGEADKSLFGKIVILGLLVGLYTVLVNAAYFYSIAVNVGSLKRLQILFTVFLAWIFLGEKYVGLRMLGAIIIFAGALLIALK